MSTAALPLDLAARLRGALAQAWQVWRATSRRQWAWVLLIGLVIGLVGLPHRIETTRTVGWFPFLWTVEFAFPLYVSVILFLGASLAHATAADERARRLRLVVALLVGAAVATLSGIVIWRMAGGFEVWAEYAARHGKPERSPGLMMLAEYLNILLLGGLVFAVVEVIRRRQGTQRAFEAVVGQQASLEQQVLESRLAAMQAQVEPRFLFDTLVDIEALYARDAQQGAAQLDRLTSYLRAALPRLRETGSTLEAELGLVRAYLEVVTARHGGRPQLRIEVADACRGQRFYPMLLLPLVQRAVRQPSGALPQTIAVDVRREGGHIAVRLRVALPGGCTDDAELSRVRERLVGLFGADASLECFEHDGDTTVLVLRVPNGHASPA